MEQENINIFALAYCLESSFNFVFCPNHHQFARALINGGGNEAKIIIF